MFPEADTVTLGSDGRIGGPDRGTAQSRRPRPADRATAGRCHHGDAATHRAGYLHELHWHDVPLQDRAEKITGPTVAVEHDVEWAHGMTTVSIQALTAS